jgi:6,7-dimethyl-8-ribityllumazine synthase
MDQIKTTEGDRIVRDARFAIVASRFNDFIVESLVKGALTCLRAQGASDADIEIFPASACAASRRRPGSTACPSASAC